MTQGRQLAVMGALLLIGAVVAARRRPGRDSMLTADYLMGLPDLGRESAFDNIDLPRFAGFWRSWKLVTVRYRKDNGEQRFVYANDIAWKAMRDGRARYPDGAMFGKIAFATSDDATFPNSAEPARFARLQLMLKDSKGHAGSDGWAYAIIIGHGRPPYDSVQSTTAACHACHQAVPGRDYVFSTPAFGPGRPSSGLSFDARFTLRETSTLSEAQRAALGYLVDARDSRDFATIRELNMHLFEGSLDESIGVLARYAARDTEVYALWDDASSRFLVERPLPSTEACHTRVQYALGISARRWTIRGRESGPAVRTGTICDAVRAHKPSQ